jgi:hypothetical protein
MLIGFFDQSNFRTSKVSCLLRVFRNEALCCDPASTDLTRANLFSFRPRTHGRVVVPLPHAGSRPHIDASLHKGLPQLCRFSMGEAGCGASFPEVPKP